MTVPVRWFIISIKRYMLISLILATISTLFFCIYVLKWTNSRSHPITPASNHLFLLSSTLAAVKYKTDEELISAQYYNISEARLNALKRKLDRISRKVRKSKTITLNSKSNPSPNYNIHIFYYAWYGNPEFDGRFKHWNHQYLPNWKHEDRKVYPTGSHQPPVDIGSNYYPQLGCYSSSDPKVIDRHFKQLRDTGIGVVILSWAPPGHTDSPDKIMDALFVTAEKYGLKIAPHIEPYTNRNPINLHGHLQQFFKEYGNHTALFRMKKPIEGNEVPVVYIYDSYLIPASAWKEMLSVRGNLSVRGTHLDGIYLGLLVDMQHRAHIKKSHFDGFYTYFASNGFTYGSSWKNWRSLAKYAQQFGLIFVPSVGPGYVDTQVRPWNSANTKHRRHGQYYEVAWQTAINNKVNYVSITSFNEWHEGTQIEPAISASVHGFNYLNYEPEGPNFYLNLTAAWIHQFTKAFIT